MSKFKNTFWLYLIFETFFKNWIGNKSWGRVDSSRLVFYFKKTFIFYLIKADRGTVVIKIKIKLKKIT